jgi:hypothetical protein
MAGDCPNDIPFESYVDLSTTRAEWLDDLALSGGCNEQNFTIMGLAEGACGNGITWILRLGLTWAEVRYHDAGGDFSALANRGDEFFSECGLTTHYPGPADCPQPVVTEIHCGTWWDLPNNGPLTVGQPIALPRVVYPREAPLAYSVLLAPGIVALAWARLRRRFLRPSTAFDPPS